MVELNVVESYQDDRGNVIVCDERHDSGITVIFRGSNNRLEIAPGARFTKLRAVFDCSNGSLTIGKARRSSRQIWAIRIGEDATVVVGDNVTTSGQTSISAVEGVTVTVGDDVMISSDVKIRGDDGHPIFDVRTGKRVNPSLPITVGDHVWLGWGSRVFGGASIGSGSVIGASGVVKGTVPNNCVAAGVPARVLRRDIAWERPHLSFDEPPYKPDISAIRKTKRYWNLTEGSARPRRRLWFRIVGLVASRSRTDRTR